MVLITSRTLSKPLNADYLPAKSNPSTTPPPNSQKALKNVRKSCHPYQVSKNSNNSWLRKVITNPHRFPHRSRLLDKILRARVCCPHRQRPLYRLRKWMGWWRRWMGLSWVKILLYNLFLLLFFSLVNTFSLRLLMLFYLVFFSLFSWYFLILLDNNVLCNQP